MDEMIKVLITDTKALSTADMMFSKDVPALVPDSDSSSASCDVKVESLCSRPSVERLDEVPACCDSPCLSEEIPTRRITWGTVEIHKHPIIAGDHPDCVMGPPLTIAWEQVKTVTTPVDEFEKSRTNRRATDDLRLSWIDRRRKLRRLGFTDEEMRQAQAAAEKTRKQREKTLSWLRFSKVEEVQQAILRKLGRTIHPKRVAKETKY